MGEGLAFDDHFLDSPSLFILYQDEINPVFQFFHRDFEGLHPAVEPVTAHVQYNLSGIVDYVDVERLCLVCMDLQVSGFRSRVGVEDAFDGSQSFIGGGIFGFRGRVPDAERLLYGPPL